MATIKVENPDTMTKKIKPFSIINIETLISTYLDEKDNMEFDFQKEKINQDKFLAYLQSKHG